ncbi:hypothetical protein BGZ80_004211, partial [Entomortierella chlamydospora]
MHKVIATRLPHSLYYPTKESSSPDNNNGNTNTTTGEETPVDGWQRTIDGLPDYTAEPRGRAKGVEWKLRAK